MNLAMNVLGAAVAQNVFFYIIAVIMVAAALRVVTTNNIVHAALYLVVVLAGVAAQFILLGAEFVGQLGAERGREARGVEGADRPDAGPALAQRPQRGRGTDPETAHRTRPRDHDASTHRGAV